MQEASGRRATGQDEGPQRVEHLVEFVNLPFKADDQRIGHLQAAALVLSVTGKAKIGAEVEQIVLNAREHDVELGLGVTRMQTGQPDGGIGLIDRAVGLNPQIVFRHALA